MRIKASEQWANNAPLEGGPGSRWSGGAATLTNDHNYLAPAILIASETTVAAVFFLISWFDVPAD